jgi:uncharacterized RDD family membrane protein YckC
MEILDSEISSNNIKVKRIGFGKRLLAMIIDFILFFLICGILSFIFAGLITGLLDAFNINKDITTVAGIFGALAGLLFILPFMYFIYYLIEGFTGYTLGKFILGIRVGTEDGKIAGTSVLIMRYLIKSSSTFISIISLFTGIEFLGTISTFCSFILFVGCFLVLTENRQSIHDLLSKTAVYNKKDLIL